MLEAENLRPENPIGSASGEALTAGGIQIVPYAGIRDDIIRQEVRVAQGSGSRFCNNSLS